MFSNLTPNSVLYIADLKGTPKIVNGLIERISLPRPKYNNFNPTLEMVVDITANIGGERREFKSIPNNSIADFKEDGFILAENKDTLVSYITSMRQNSQKIVDSMEKHQSLIAKYDEVLNELNPSQTDSKVIQDLQNQISTLQQGMQTLLEKLNKGNTN